MMRRLDHTRTFQIGVVRASLTTPLRRLRREFSSLYEPYESVSLPGDPIRVEVIPGRLLSRRRRRFNVSVNGDVRFQPSRREELLPYVEWAIGWELPQSMPQYLQLHAASMEIDGAGVIFPGESGSGKSTLTAGLLTRGWRYLCDEFALIHVDSLTLHPFPRAICLKQPSHVVIESVGLRLSAPPGYLKGSKGYVGFLDPLSHRPDAIGRVCPIRHIIFPRYVRGAEPTLIPIGRAEAVLDLHRVCFNLFRCHGLGIDVLSAIARQASCFRLVSGHLERTCALVHQRIRSASRPRLRSA